MSKAEKWDPLCSSALHVVKGALVKVLKTPLTTGVTVSSRTKGRISVEYNEQNAPTKEQVDEIEKLMNQKIKQNVPIQVFEIDRKEAEEKYKKNPVNDTFIYDKWPVPESVTTLRLIYIEDWNINCSAGKVVPTTGELGSIKISRVNHRPQKKEVEFCFEIGEATSAETTKESSESNKSAKKTPSSTAEKSQPNPQQDCDNVLYVTDRILDLLLQHQTGEGQVDPQQLRTQLKPQLLPILTSLKNTAYTRGFQARAPQASK